MPALLTNQFSMKAFVKASLLYLLKLVAFVIFFQALCMLGNYMELEEYDGLIKLIWPAAGMGLAAVVIGGYRYIPGILIGYLVWSHLDNLTYEQGLYLGVVYGATAGIGRLLLVSLMKLDQRLETIYDIGVFLLVGTVLGAMISAGLSVSFLDLYIEEQYAFEQIFWPWLLGDLMGLLIVAPFAMVWHVQTKIYFSNRQALEILLWMFTLVMIGWIVFYNWAPIDTLRYPLELTMFPIMAWAAVRFGQRGATTGIVIVAIVAFREVAWVLGPEQRVISQSPSFLWMFVGIISATSLFIGAVMTEHQRREEESVANEGRIRAFIDAMPDLAFVISTAGKFLDVFTPQQNERYKEVREALLDEHVETVFDEPTAVLFQETVSKALDTGKSQSVEYAYRFNEQEHWYEGRVAPMADEQGKYNRVVWFAYDITQRKATEDLLHYRDDLMNSVNQAQVCLLAVKEYKKAVSKAFEHIGKRLGASAVLAVEVSEEDTQSCPYDWRSTAAQPATIEPVIVPELQEQIHRNGYLCAMASTATGVTAALLEACNAKSALVVAIVINEKLWGAICVIDLLVEREWTAAEIAAMNLLAASIGGFIMNQHAAEELLQAKEASESANNAKSEFLALISHEIRTPINAILGFTDLLDQTANEPIQKEHIGVIRRSGKDLLEMINTLLDFSKIESRGLDLDIMPFVLENTVMEALELVNVRAKEKGIILQYESEEQHYMRFFGDSMRIRQVLLNLLNNAVKFTDKGYVTLEKSVELIEGNRYKISFAVIDTGIGIEAEKIEHLFEPFTQADSSTTRRFGGTGLGLAICKRLVERMGGVIAATSEAGEGSRFSFELVLERTEEAVPLGQREEVYSEHEFAKQCPLSVLLVSQSPSTNQEMLSLIGYSPFVAATVDEAIELAKQETIDLAIVDYQKGFAEQCDSLCKAVSFVVVEGSLDAQEKETIKEQGVRLTTTKPISLVKLKAFLQQSYKEKAEAMS